MLSVFHSTYSLGKIMNPITVSIQGVGWGMEEESEETYLNLLPFAYNTTEGNGYSDQSSNPD